MCHVSFKTVTNYFDFITGKKGLWEVNSNELDFLLDAVKNGLHKR